MPLPRPASPRAFLEDLRAFAAQRSRHQWIAAFFAVAMPVAILFLFMLDIRSTNMSREQVIFVDSWSGARSDAEIRAAQQVRQRERERAEAQRREEWKQLGRRVGMDP
jgi:hypothetical protein